jgi:hypothetical protein
MSQQIGGYPPVPATGATGVPTGATGAPTGQQPTTQVARDEAQDVGRTAADAGRHVAGTAAEQAGNVAQEVKTQARDLVGEARSQVRSQAHSGQQKAADGIRALSQELREMADTGQSGTVSEVARQAAARVDLAADWLSRREPADLVDELRSFARRRPGAFLLGAALAGVAVGRLTRGAVDAARTDSGSAPYAGGPGYARTPAPQPVYRTEPGVPAGAPYDAPTPPRGHVTPRPYAPEPTGTPAASPLPPASPGAVHDPEPTGRHSPGAVGDYADDLGRGGRRGAEPFDEPYRPGGDFR